MKKKTQYKCDYCLTKYYDVALMAAHEAKCTQNPKNLCCGCCSYFIRQGIISSCGLGRGTVVRDMKACESYEQDAIYYQSDLDGWEDCK